MPEVIEERDFLSIDDVSGDELRTLLDEADAVKAAPGRRGAALADRQVALIFEKPSTRTRVSFEAAVTGMGGDAIVLRADELQLGRGETIEDTGRALSRYVHGIVVRTFGQDRLERLAQAASVPVINALSDFEHPCQALADLQTILEKFGRLEGVKLAYVGDGNNVAHSLMLGGVLAGMDVRVAAPFGYEPFPQVSERAAEIAAGTPASITVTNVVSEAVHEADVIYTDVWTSMGQEGSEKQREDAFDGFQVNQDLIDMASDEVVIMHCLPAHRGEEISAEAMDGPRSIVWDQAENRLHAQKALLAWLLS